RIPSVPVGRDALGMIGSRDSTSSDDASGRGGGGASDVSGDASVTRRRSTPAAARRLGMSSVPGWSASALKSWNSCGGGGAPGNAAAFRDGRANDRYSRMLATGSIVRALRAAHLHDAPRAELLRLACDRIRGLGAPYTSVYAYMLHGDELVLEAFSGRETEHT